MVSADTVDTIIIGAGHAGLSVSHCLAERSIDHLVLERGEVANSWRSERWDSLTLLTPNWQTRLPGFAYRGDDPDGFMRVAELVDFIDTYAVASGAPVKKQTEVTSVRAQDGGYRVCSNNGTWQCRAVIIASGACNKASIPSAAAALPEAIHALSSLDYRNPEQLPQGGVLVVGASATGLQLAQEIHASGRPVTIAVGEHVRMPRTYRGKDIQWWMDAVGILDEGLADVDDVKRVRRVPSPQLVGSQRQPIFDLNAMQAQGIEVVGRLMGCNGGVAQFSGSLPNVCSLADLKMGRLLDAIDAWAAASPEAVNFPPPERFARTVLPESPRLTMDLEANGIASIIWATGYRPDYSWLDVDVLDRKGMLRHEGGVVDAPGLYALGLTFLRKRKSSFIHGTEDDARHITAHLAQYLAGG